MHILITGGAGFVGSNLAYNFKSAYPQYKITCLDNLKRQGSELNLPLFKKHNIGFLHADIRNKEDLESIPPIDFFIDAAAEPSVLAGINSPVHQVVNNNLIGTLNCLEVANKYNASFIFLSTSRVYPIKKLEELSFEELDTRFHLKSNQNLPGASGKGISENFSIAGSRSFYGATKLASELLIEEYNALANLPVVINRCGVISGPRQMGKVDQGVVVLWMARHFWKKNLSYVGYGGTGKQVRDILHIQDLYDLIDYQVHHMNKVNGQTFNVGGGIDCSISLKELTTLCQNITGNTLDIKKVPEARTADIRIYISDCSKVSNICSWSPKKKINDVLQDIFGWLKENERDLKPILE